MRYVHLKCLFVLFLSLLLSQSIALASYNWNEGEPLPSNGLDNPYELHNSQIADFNRQGRLHALNYPVTVTGALLPYNATRNLIKRSFGNFDILGKWLGLHTYPEQEGEGPYFTPFPDGQRPNVRMGVSAVPTETEVGLTFSCVACHSATLFGTRVIGMTNRFPKANDMFLKGKKGLKALNSKMFQGLSSASKEEVAMYVQTKKNLDFVEARKPSRAGLDTSLAHVALSLSRRSKDAFASKDPELVRRPRKEKLRQVVSDSKPAVWWTVKYKNRWLLDGSVVSGNPIFTNLLWNEIGRGTDLDVLQTWLNDNQKIIQELTTAVYQTTPPLITDFFPEEYFDIASAKRGETLFKTSCNKCHGNYVKGWSQDTSLSLKDQLKTIEVKYFEQTPVKNVGTDPYRRQGMESLLQLNDLQIAKENGIKIKVSDGYVPQPLIGIWARYPYFHNNSVPSLCQLLTPAKDRVKTYLAREAIDTKKDFDFNCNGYPIKKSYSLKERSSSKYFDTRKAGLSNSGHDKMFLNEAGQSIYTDQERQDLIHYLQVL